MPHPDQDACSAATKLDDALADVESYIVNGGYETIFDGKERHTILMDRRKALAALTVWQEVIAQQADEIERLRAEVERLDEIVEYERG